jgi:glycosyltransferase involved in cell wall biosynthesis
MELDATAQTAARARHGEAPPRVSIVIPSYNHERFVGRAIESAFAQTYQNFEIVITDDASTDGSVDVLSSYARKDSRIKLFCNRFNYETHAVNHCIQHSSGDYIAMLASDDEFFPAKLETQVEFLDRHPEVAAVFTQARIIDEQDRDFPDPSHFYCTIFQQPNRSRHEWLRHFFFKSNCLCQPSALIRRSVYDTLGLYNPLMGALDDLDMWVRVCLHHEIHVLPDTLVNFRVRDGEANVSGDTPENFRRGQYELIKILDHFLSPEALAQLHLIFPEFGDHLVRESDAAKRHMLAKAALATGHLAHRFWGIDLLYQLLSHPDTRRQLSHRIGRAPDVDFVKLNGALNPLAVEHRATTQVFWPAGAGYSEVNSHSRFCPRSQWTDLRFPIPIRDMAMPLRVDPSDCPGVIKIAALRILAQTDGRCLWSCPLEDKDAAVTLAGSALLLSDQATFSILSTGKDPQLLLHRIPPLPDLPLELQIWIKLEPGLEAVAREIESLRVAIESTKAAELQREVTRLTAETVALHATITERDRRTTMLQAAIAERDHQSTRMSRSWRYTRPLRAVFGRRRLS